MPWCWAATSTWRPPTKTCGTRAPATAAPTSRERERAAVAALRDWGLVDTYRHRHPDARRYTWWDYRAGNFQKNFGMRIDLLLATRPVAERTVWAEIDREARKGKPIPSDHAPLLIDIDAARPSARRRLGLGRKPHRANAQASVDGALMAFPIEPPVPPMLAKLADGAPAGRRVAVRAEVGRLPRHRVPRRRQRLHRRAATSSRSTATSPSSTRSSSEHLPERCVVDGEIVIASARGLDFDALQMRLHPAASRVKKLAAEIPAAFVAFDLLAEGSRDLRALPQAERRRLLETGRLRQGPTGLHLTPCRRDREIAADWFHRFEGAGLDGVIAKHEQATYQPGKRAMVKIKHARTRRLRRGRLPLAQERAGHAGRLAAPRPLRRRGHAAPRRRHVVVHDGRAPRAGARSSSRCARTRSRRTRGASGREYEGGTQRMPGGQSRWSAGKDLSWEPLRIERVCEVKYDHLQGDRFRHAAVFLRWRPDKAARRLPLRPARGHSARRARRDFSPGGIVTPFHGS